MKLSIRWSSTRNQKLFINFYAKIMFRACQDHKYKINVFNFHLPSSYPTTLENRKRFNYKSQTVWKFNPLVTNRPTEPSYPLFTLSSKLQTLKTQNSPSSDDLVTINFLSEKEANQGIFRLGEGTNLNPVHRELIKKPPRVLRFST